MLPIEENTDAAMREIAKCMEKFIGKEKYGFMVLVFPFSDGPSVAHYISNASRKDMINALREKADVLEAKLDISIENGDVQ